MTARRAVTRLLSLSARALTGVCGVAAVGWGFGACYSAGSGANPPANILYYPVGVAVSGGGDYLYVANSDFDLQWNGGTLQSYDLTRLRHDTASLIFQNLNPGVDGGMLSADTGIPFVFPPNCLGQNNANPAPWPNGQRPILGQSCSPPVDSTKYVIESAIIGAFASDLQLSVDGTRLFVPVRGDATLTWASLVDKNQKPLPGTFDCGQAKNGNRCGQQVGNDPNAVGDTRHITLPGEPFGMAQSGDGTAIAITQQATQETSLLLSGTGPGPTSHPGVPSMQFVLEGVPTGGNGIVAVPHDPDAVVRCEDPAVNDGYPCVRAAFLQTSRNAGEVDLLRYYDDEGSPFSDADAGSPAQGSSLRRPFLVKELPYAVTVNTPGIDQRGIVIDPTPRLKCKAQAAATGMLPEKAAACGQIPARVFIGSRSPSSVIYGTIGGFSLSGDGTYDPDQLHMLGSVPLLDGPSRLYLAPIVDGTGHYALRLFIVCYDSNVVFVFDPEQVQALGQTAVPEAVLNVGPGPFAMAFDPFCGTTSPTSSTGTTGLVDASGAKSPSAMMLDCTQYGPFADVAVSEAHAGEAGFLVPAGTLPNDAAYGLRRYRFGYLTSFTQSYIQVLDLDDSLQAPPPAPPNAPARSQETFEDVVFTFGNPTPPKGS